MKKLGTQISDYTAELLTKDYGSANRGARRIMASWHPLKEIVIEGLKGHFVAKELDHLIKIQRNMEYHPQYALMVETLALRLKANPYNKELEIKVKALDGPQALFLSDWIDCYYNIELNRPEDLDNYREELLG